MEGPKSIASQMLATWNWSRKHAKGILSVSLKKVKHTKEHVSNRIEGTYRFTLLVEIMVFAVRDGIDTIALKEIPARRQSEIAIYPLAATWCRNLLSAHARHAYG